MKSMREEELKRRHKDESVARGEKALTPRSCASITHRVYTQNLVAEPAGIVVAVRCVSAI
jgi:hypothetical protein